MGINPVEPSPTESAQPAAYLDPTAVPPPDLGVPTGPYTEPVGASEAGEVAVAERQALAAESNSPDAPTAVPGGSKELLKLALPLIVSQSFMTVQVFVDTVLLSWHDPLEMAASFPAVMWYWLFFGLLQVTAGYTSTFVAQYTGAKRPHRVGAAVWQGIHFAIVAGLLFLVMVPAAPFLIAVSGHPADIQPLEATYLKCLAFAALPMLVMGAVNGFFSGRGQTWTVLGIEAVGTAVNIALALVLIFGRLGFPELGIEGAGWATVAGSWAAALFALALMLRKKYRDEFGTLAGWKPERELFRRLMIYGGPAGMQVFLDVLVFHCFTVLVGNLGFAALGATTLTIRLNMIAFLPMMGMGQAICILVGQRLGGNRPDLAEKSTYTGLKWAFGYMCLIALAYVTIPSLLVEPFRPDKPEEQEKFAAVVALVPTLLLCVAVFSVADAVNVSFAFALRGAGDTKYVTKLTFALAWPLMVIPTAITVFMGGSVYWCWVFATLHILGMSACFWFRFRSGKWKSMRVIEPGVEDDKSFTAKTTEGAEKGK
ncbi:mate efflux family protein : Putative efflux protein, MATE family OS=Singulisphaera acidiphila (strain ATCC BAA-1392 / DSM 18658 / VKM B-2454 / MOB10) GN=Sinac_0087 PE=4 SV=1: MatE: MatE [Gemmata massiliana]|uniref:MATE efflux family protein n=1 Tax=Gemmata massiliana TaxID=1210884 RepID=A0A6P2DKW6_9BACT|nr:MATE family efflux transporter [Gemmata massiliana]VTS03106.1 mate efflux family protein : Putative efflux protein, MATE family OS=Singulisphaera acidiphila (strain ATCC BAA-1392 / DSM 18658 / VKM B-2454 / MOB10) GN=Sinac_0087 PE=4 SV=1: MatE: MatE [Gemmata massiliana]